MFKLAGLAALAGIISSLTKTLNGISIPKAAKPQKPAMAFGHKRQQKVRKPKCKLASQRKAKVRSKRKR